MSSSLTASLKASSSRIRTTAKTNVAAALSRHMPSSWLALERPYAMRDGGGTSCREIPLTSHDGGTICRAGVSPGMLPRRAEPSKLLIFNASANRREER